MRSDEEFFGMREMAIAGMAHGLNAVRVRPNKVEPAALGVEELLLRQRQCLTVVATSSKAVTQHVPKRASSYRIIDQVQKLARRPRGIEIDRESEPRLQIQQPSSQDHTFLRAKVLNR